MTGAVRARCRRHAAVSVAASNYDCSNTVWTFDSLRAGGKKVAKRCAAPSWGVKGGCACRDVGDTFGAATRVGHEANLLSWGSTFKGARRCNGRGTEKIPQRRNDMFL
jgi:hypothetical protein